MGVMSEISADREQELNEAHIAWLEAEEDLRKLQDASEIMQRDGAQWMAIVNQRQVCGVLQMKYARAKSDRYKVTINQGKDN